MTALTVLLISVVSAVEMFNLGWLILWERNLLEIERIIVTHYEAVEANRKKVKE